MVGSYAGALNGCFDHNMGYVNCQIHEGSTDSWVSICCIYCMSMFKFSRPSHSFKLSVHICHARTPCFRAIIGSMSTTVRSIFSLRVESCIHVYFHAFLYCAEAEKLASTLQRFFSRKLIALGTSYCADCNCSRNQDHVDVCLIFVLLANQ